jgi:hypothetical protein
MMSEKTKTVDLREIFLGLQKEMAASLSSSRQIIPHAGTKGTASELHWLTMLNNYLPERYFVDNAFVLDCDGNLSDQIDVVIYDRQYSPFLFNQNFVKYVPAESVYAVLEVRQEIDLENVKYAGEKVASVRQLRRTSVPIPHAAGVYEAKKPGPILGGLLTLDSAWKPPLGDAFVESIASLGEKQRLDIGCVLENGGFAVTYDGASAPSIQISSPETSLISFFLQLVSGLRNIGTVPALDFSEYGRVL